MKIYCKTLMAMIALAVATTPLAAETRTGGAFSMSARVPEICRISTGTFTVGPDSVVSGTVQELCNTNSAFRILASHRTLATDEIATVSYAGTQATLSPTGLTDVTTRMGASVKVIPITIDARNIDQPIAVAFTLTVL